MRAYLLFKAKPQDMMRLMHDLKENPKVLRAALVHGPYDCVAVIQGHTLDDLNETVMGIRAHSGILETMTSLVVQSWERAAA